MMNVVTDTAVMGGVMTGVMAGIFMGGATAGLAVVAGGLVLAKRFTSSVISAQEIRMKDKDEKDNTKALANVLPRKHSVQIFLDQETQQKQQKHLKNKETS